MSLLPQRKKSAEEIAKLRESLGIPGQAPVDQLPSDARFDRPEATEAPSAARFSEPPQAPRPETEAPPEPVLESSPLAPLPIAAPPKQVRSLKKAERVPMLPTDSPLPAAPAPEVPILGKKIVKSLKKSEQIPLAPVQVPQPGPDSKLPLQRHSEEEIRRIRRQEAIALQATTAKPSSLAAHVAVVIPAYVLLVAGTLNFYYYEWKIQVTAACVALALAVATYLFFKKPLSRHHAAFISVMALFVIVFGALHYFPQLRHGS
jgi:hypothetical protein